MVQPCFPILARLGSEDAATSSASGSPKTRLGASRELWGTHFGFDPSGAHRGFIWGLPGLRSESSWSSRASKFLHDLAAKTPEHLAPQAKQESAAGVQPLDFRFGGRRVSCAGLHFFFVRDAASVPFSLRCFLDLTDKRANASYTIESHRLYYNFRENGCAIKAVSKIS